MCMHFIINYNTCIYLSIGSNNIHVRKASNNFASHECGAKVIATNPEARVRHDCNYNIKI